MSVNFGYNGYGMMNGMGINNMNGSAGNVFQNISSQYSCPACYQYGPVPYSLQTNVNPLPPYAIHQTWLSRLIKRVFG